MFAKLSSAIIAFLAFTSIVTALPQRVNPVIKAPHSVQTANPSDLLPAVPFDAGNPSFPTPPAPTQPGLISTCNAYTVVDVAHGSCAAIEKQFNISFAQFLAWNPAIGSGCTNLWLGEAYCVGISG